MSKGQQYLDRRTEQNQTVVSEAVLDDEVQENEASSFYAGIQNTFDAGKAAVEVHPSDEPTWTEDTVAEKSPQVRWIAALNAKRNDIAVVQSGENPFTMEDYREEFGSSLPVIESAEIDEGVIDLLESVGYDDADDLRGREVPVVDGEPLPVMVSNDSELNEALALLSEVPEEPEPVGTPEPETNPLEDAAEDIGVDLTLVESVVQEWGDPSDGATVDDIRGWVNRKGDRRLTNLREAQVLLAVERASKNRTTAVDALEGRYNALERAGEISGSGEEAYLSEDTAESEQEAEDTDDTGEGERVAKDDGVTVEVSVTIPEDAGRGTRLKEAGNLMEMGYDEETAMEMVGL